MNVEVICLMDDRQSPWRETSNGVDIFRIPLKHRRGATFEYLFRYSLFIILAFSTLALRSLTRRYHLVHVHNMPDILILSALVPKALGAKVILDLHDPMPELVMTIFGFEQRSLMVRFLQRLEKWSIALADAVLTVNLACQKIFTSRSCPQDKLRVVMNSPDEQIFGFRAPCLRTTTVDGLNMPFVIMYHGSLVERNGVDLAVDALARLRESVPTAELRIYGIDTPFLQQVMESVRERGLYEAVHYLGPKRLEDLVKAIGQCDVGIIPNHRSIFTEINTPTRILEYLAVGKPVIAPRTQGIQDYFDDGSLVFFELGNSADLARQIEYVFCHPREALEIVKRGQQVYSTHTWCQERMKLVNLAAELLSNGEAPA